MPTPTEYLARAEDALDAALAAPLGSTVRASRLSEAQALATLAFASVLAPVAAKVAAEQAAPDPEDALLGLTHPPKAPRKPRAPKSDPAA